MSKQVWTDEEIERLKGDLQVTRLQRDARMVSEFVVDDAVKAEIERLRNGLELIADPGDITSVEELGHIARFYLQESK